MHIITPHLHSMYIPRRIIGNDSMLPHNFHCNHKDTESRLILRTSPMSAILRVTEEGFAAAYASFKLQNTVASSHMLLEVELCVPCTFPGETLCSLTWKFIYVAISPHTETYIVRLFALLCFLATTCISLSCSLTYTDCPQAHAR